MKKWNSKELINNGYRIENAKITAVDLSMEDHGCLTLKLVLEGGGWGCVYGGYALGHGYLDADDFEGSAAGMESIMRIMDVVGVEKFNDMRGKYIRVCMKNLSEQIKIIGNIIKEKWFDAESFYKNKES